MACIAQPEPSTIWNKVLIPLDDPFLDEEVEIDGAAPEVAADQDDGHARDLSGLDQGQDLEELIHRSEPARKDHQAFARRRRCILRIAKYRDRKQSSGLI